MVVVLPVKCRELHRATSPLCWCEPSLEWFEEVALKVHNHPGGDLDTDWTDEVMESETPISRA